MKADPSEWMRCYFDAFVYTANWCSCRLALRVPLTTFRKTELKPYAGHSLTIEASDEHWIIDWSLDESENHDRFGMDDGTAWMRRLAPLRDELLRGDLRPLYLGWLAAADELGDDAREPEVPPGLANLSPPQQALAEFIEVDPDMLAAAAAGRERDIRSRLSTWRKAQRPKSDPGVARRNVGQLRELAQSAMSVRRQREAEERAAQETEDRRQRETFLRLLMALLRRLTEAGLWSG